MCYRFFEIRITNINEIGYYQLGKSKVPYTSSRAYLVVKFANYKFLFLKYKRGKRIRASIEVCLIMQTPGCINASMTQLI